MTAASLDADARGVDGNGSEARPERWAGVFAMSLCVFALIASEFMPVSLLTPMAADLGVSEGVAGQGLAISGAFAVLASLSVASLAGRRDRKALLLGLTALMCLSGGIIALAGNFATYMAGRALIGVVVGGFWSLSAATTLRLVPTSKVPRALAILNGGNALATVLAAPLGSYLGSVVGWRGAFFCLVPISLLALVWLWISLPALPAQGQATRNANPVRLLRVGRVALGMLAVGVFFSGQFALFTYLRPFLETVTRVHAAQLSAILLVIGVAGLAGTLLIGAVLKHGLYRTLLAAPVLMAVTAVGLALSGTAVLPVTGLLAAWGFVATATPVGWWMWIARTMPKDAEAGGGLMVAVVQLAIASGSTLGGVLFDHHGHLGTFIASAALLLASALLVFVTARADRRSGAR
ncbi:MFS transporter [Roseateles sp. UC29_93]|uniref:MFS transporter n=1 Tax=Roseateles sp. UC29_93 TaxID=3350177 RepID=UPI00366D2877